jgi:phospholipid/cholesterol/gamma-HCH transport system permease protein
MEGLEKLNHKITLPSLVEGVGRVVAKGIRERGQVALFTYTSLATFWRKPSRYQEIIQQIEFIGNQSIFIIFLASMFTGMVFALQIYSAFHLVKTEILIGPSVALALTRELGPVLTGLLVTGRAGAAISAQLGTMRVTEQIDALEVMGVNPKQYLVMPRIIASVIATPLLTGIFDFVGNIGAYFISIKLLHIDAALYLAKINVFTRPKDIAQSLIKAAFFGLIFSVIGTYKGFNTENGARGVGQATNETVVISSILILISDYFLSAIIRMLFYGSDI